MTRDKLKAEFGDFQTPVELARSVCRVLARQGWRPKSLVEPTCGQGSLLFAALDQFPSLERAIGLDVSHTYTLQVRSKLGERCNGKSIEVFEGDFFRTDWSTLLSALPEPLLVIGNPPWVTNSHLSALKSANLPEKSNLHKHAGFDAMTGKSNFDISESMLIRMLHWLDGREALLAMLCKTAVARKLLSYAWKNGVSVSGSAIYRVDAAAHFAASVQACLLVCEFSRRTCNQTCRVYDGLDHPAHARSIGYRAGSVIASLELFERWKHLAGDAKIWRSGVKHDCSRVMELSKEGDAYRNGFDELVELEDEFLYPMFKSSELTDGSDLVPKRRMLVTQRSVHDDTAAIERVAPQTWRYLQSHANLLDRRGSAVYKKRARFAVFGVGDYTFSSWKVAISGFYKRLAFKAIGSFDGKPVVFDDTCYFIPCATREEAERLATLLNSSVAREFFEAFIFWDNKRPVTAETLNRLNLEALARELAEFGGGRQAARKCRVEKSPAGAAR